MAVEAIAPIAHASLPDQIPAVPALELSPTRAVSAGPPSHQPPRRPRERAGSRVGTVISSLLINLTSGRIALNSPDGGPVLGDVSTDLAVGCYTLTPDFVGRRWIFDPRQVKEGKRFRVALDGADPFELSYAPALRLSVTSGLSLGGEDSLESTQLELRSDLEDGEHGAALVLLDSLNDVDLYDLVQQVWADEPGIVLALLGALEKSASGESLNLFRILRALESVAVPREKLFIDAFKRFYIDPRSFARDEDREKAGKTTLQLRFEYWLTPERALTVYADDITDTLSVLPGGERYGEGALLFPAFCTRGRTPRMWQAKKDVLASIEQGNMEFMASSVAASMHVINFVFMASSLVTGTIPSVGAPRTKPRPITAAYRRQPGRWMPDFEAGLNMSEADAAYEARVCSKDPGIGYYVNGVQFDGVDLAEKILIDAKNYGAERGTTRALLNNNYHVGMKLLEQAESQVQAAPSEFQVVWKVASPQAAEKLQQLFRVNKVPVQVLHVP
jgi:hypothetical protein